jgi:hypothetical protein
LALKSNHIAEPRFDQLFVRFQTKQFRFRHEPHAERDFQRKRSAAPLDDVDRQFRVLPRFELVFRDVKIAAVDLPQPDVRRTDQKFAFRVLEKSHRFLVVRDEHVFVVAVMVEHHFVVFASEARFFVAAERGVRRVIVIAVDPDATGFDGARNLIKLVRVARPDARAETVKRVVGDFDRFGFVFESRHRRDRTEDFFLENAHFVVSFD